MGRLTPKSSAAQAWNRSDARAAKALSLRGQAENDAMRKAHREAAKALYNDHDPRLHPVDPASKDEIYIDLHGLHPEEAVEYLETVLESHGSLDRRQIVYAITGTGHHSKNGKDKVGKAIRSWLHDLNYVFREFSVPGERGGYVGGILGIEVDGVPKHPTLTRAAENKRRGGNGHGGGHGDGNGGDRERQEGGEGGEGKAGPATAVMGKIQLLKRDGSSSS